MVVVVRKLQRAKQEILQVHVFPNHLTRGRRLAFMEKVSAPELFGRQAQRSGDLIHLPLERENALGRAEAAKGSVRRRGGRDCPAADANVGAGIRPGSVNRAATFA